MTTNRKKQIRPEVVHLGERVTATLTAVAEVVKDHHHDHQYRVANLEHHHHYLRRQHHHHQHDCPHQGHHIHREDVEWCTANVLCSYVEV